MKPYDRRRALARRHRKVDDAEGMWKAYDESGKSVMRTSGRRSQLRAVFPPSCRIGFRSADRTAFFTIPRRRIHERRYTTADELHSLQGGEKSTSARSHSRSTRSSIGSSNSCEVAPQRRSLVSDRLRESVLRILAGHVAPHALPLASVKAYVKWAIFCAATKRKMRKNQNWEPLIEVSELDPLLVRREARSATRRSQRRAASRTAKFEEFCATHLKNLDEKSPGKFFGTQPAKDAVRQKVTALFPAHEVEKFTEHFWSAHPRSGASEGIRSPPGRSAISHRRAPTPSKVELERAGQ